MPRSILLTLTTLFIGGLSSAGEFTVSAEVPSVIESPRISFTVGEPVRARWSDGKTAILKEEIVNGMPFKVPMPMNGSTCAKTPPAKCSIESPVRIRKMFFVWETHPTTPTRVSKVLKLINKETGKHDGFAG